MLTAATMSSFGAVVSRAVSRWAASPERPVARFPPRRPSATDWWSPPLPAPSTPTFTSDRMHFISRLKVPSGVAEQADVGW